MDLCEGHCQDCKKVCIGLRIATKIVSGIKNTETKPKCLVLNAEEFNNDKVADVSRTEESSHKNEQTCQESMFIRYPTILKIREVVQLKDYIQNTLSCNACWQRLPSQPKEMLDTEHTPTKPFECVAADLFTIDGKEYLVYMDRLSG